MYIIIIRQERKPARKAQLPGRYGNKENKMEMESVTVSCSPVETGAVYAGGWVWNYPAIAKVAGTAGNLERWAIGYKQKWEDSSKTEESFWWDSLNETRESAWEWLDSQNS